MLEELPKTDYIRELIMSDSGDKVVASDLRVPSW